MSMWPATIYKICPMTDWRAARTVSVYPGSADDRRDGFIHLSTAAQLAGTAVKHFAGQSGLVLLSVDMAALGTALRWEPARDGALFPHLYGPLPVGAVGAVIDLPLGEDGVPLVPTGLA